MSTTIIGFRPPDDLWNKHKAVWDACTAADVLWKWREDMREGYELKLSDIPPSVTVLRFYNSW